MLVANGAWLFYPRCEGSCDFGLVFRCERHPGSVSRFRLHVTPLADGKIPKAVGLHLKPSFSSLDLIGAG
jgi:hypothetical protein